MSVHRVGIDIEQFMRDPYATGIQRVLQYLAKEWPIDIPAAFVLPIPRRDDAFIALSPDSAAELLSLPFDLSGSREELRLSVDSWIEERASEARSGADLHQEFDGWLLPEVSYLPSVINRFEEFRSHAYTSMIGYDILPMVEPSNYRFSPGKAAWVSEYFRMLAVANAVVCISDVARDGITGRLRRQGDLPTAIAHPGGDHLPPRTGMPPERPTFIRVGTMETRKMPIEILEAFVKAVDEGLKADLVFVGSPSASDGSINARVKDFINAGYPIRWIEGASDAEVFDLVQGASAFLSFGVEGYGIPVLESIRVGTPVIYGGVQPAAALMNGLGAIQATSSSVSAETFHMDLKETRRCLDSEKVPTWGMFAARVAEASVSSTK